MRAMILCGGMGTRLREQTETRPKPMVEIGGTPILLHVMRMYARHGIREFVLCLGYKGSVIKEYFLDFEAMRSDFTLELGAPGAPIEYHREGIDDLAFRVTLADTGERTPTGDRVLHASRYLDGGTFAVTYGDGVSDVDLGAALAFHRAHGKLATVTGVRPPSRFGEIAHDRGRVLEFNEKPQATAGLINGGFFFFEPRFLEYLRGAPDAMLEREPLERCVRDGQLMVYEHGGFWHCMDTYRDWENLEALWRSGNAPWKVWA